MDRVKILQEISYKDKSGIYVVNAPTAVSASKTIRKILENYCDQKTALFLSGGTTPRKLYEDIASERKLRVGAILQTDERYGERLHKKSNEQMMNETGLLSYFEEENLRFYSMLEGKGIDQTANDYDETFRFLLKYFPKTIGLFGIGLDGHTAGIPSIPQISKKIAEDKSSHITFYQEDSGKYGERVTMSFLAISQLDLILILVLGQEKREMLSQMFKSDGGEEEIENFPGKFYLKPEIAKKTILITDQMV